MNKNTVQSLNEETGSGTWDQREEQNPDPCGWNHAAWCSSTAERQVKEVEHTQAAHSRVYMCGVNTHTHTLSLKNVLGGIKI